MKKESKIADFIYCPQMSAQSLAVLAYLSRKTPQEVGAKWQDAYFDYDYVSETAPWFNGRENGFVLSISKRFINLNIVCVKCRHTDGIKIYNWESGSQLNPPNLSNFTDEIYNNGYIFGEFEVKEAVNFILDLITAFLQKDENNGSFLRKS